MGIISLFDWGEANALFFFLKKFTLIIKGRSRIKVFEPFEDSSISSPIVNVIMVSYSCIYQELKLASYESFKG